MIYGLSNSTFASVKPAIPIFFLVLVANDNVLTMRMRRGRRLVNQFKLQNKSI